MQTTTETSAQRQTRQAAPSGTPESIFAKAHAAQQELRQMPLGQKMEYLKRLRQVILRDREALMTRIQAETGKCRSDALMSEIFPILDHIAYLEKHAARVLADRKVHTPIALMGKSSWIYFEPLGTILVISPWNYPFYQAIVPCTSSFVTGNTTIYKPSEHTPLQGLVEEVLQKAGFSADWVQVSYGDGAHAARLVEQKPEKIFFTGSVRTGKKIMAQAAQHLIPVELELGGKDPMIVFEDVNLQRAAAGAAWGAFTNAGQSCTSVERLYVHQSIYEPFKTALLKEVGRIKQAVDADGDADMGKMTTAFQVETVREQLNEAKQKGARILSGAEWNGKDLNIPPIVLENTKPEMRVVHEETFGPVLPLIAFQSEQEAIALANNSEYGLSASVWSKDLTRARRVARALDTGNVSVNNVMLTEGNHALPFGGVKNSGFGRYKGEFGLYAFSNIKSVLIDKNSSKIEANWYPYTRTKYQIFTDMMVGLFSGGITGFIKFIFSGLRLESYSQKASKSERRA